MQKQEIIFLNWWFSIQGESKKEKRLYFQIAIKIW
jgi:hypothetical protein